MLKVERSQPRHNFAEEAHQRKVREDDYGFLKVATSIGRVSLLSEEDVAINVAAARAVAPGCCASRVDEIGRLRTHAGRGNDGASSGRRV